MKYGDTLRRRSIPAWAPYNIDYDEIKRLIKTHTTPGNGTAVSIPGSGATVEKGFERELYSALEQEHQRINLFVKTKSGEIERKLIHLNKRVQALDVRQKPADGGSRIAVRRLERYAQMEDEILQAGKDIQSLSQYVNTQRTAFRKLLKKYRKWTKSSELGDLFNRTVIQGPDSLWTVRVRPLFEYYRDVLQAVRTSFDSSKSTTTPRSLSRWTNRPLDGSDERITGQTIAKIQGAAENGRGVDFDNALATIPLGANGSTATYWVHPESVIELQILLMRHANLVSPHGGTSSRPASSTSTPLSTSFGRTASTSQLDTADFDKEDDVGCLILDTVERYARQESGKTIKDREGKRGWPRSQAQGDIRWTSNGDTLVTVGLNSGETPEEARCLSAKIKRKHLANFLDIKAPFVRRPSSSTLGDNDTQVSDQTSDEAVSSVRTWLSQRPEVEPLVRMTCKRTRYMGLTNTSSRGLWLVLDRDVYFKKNIDLEFSGPDWLKNCRADATFFPHVLLELRYEGFVAPAIIDELDKSHLVERVRGFSLQTHAVWQCYRPQSMAAPFWLPALNKDIRKIPTTERRQSRKARNAAIAMDSSTPDMASIYSNTDGNHTSASSPIATSDTAQTSAADQLEVATPNTFRKKRKARHQAAMSPIQDTSESAGYWNEYDHPEDEEQEGYYIYLNPDESMMPKVFSNAYTKFKGFFHRRRTSDEETALLIDPQSPVDEPSDSSDEELGDDADESRRTPIAPYPANGYGTIPCSTQKPAPSLLARFLRTFRSEPALRVNTYSFSTAAAALHHENERQKSLASILCFVASLVITIMMHVLTQTGRHRFHSEVDVFLAVGIVANLAFLFAGVAYMVRREEVRWWERIVAALLFAGICAADSILLIWILDV